MQRLPPLKGQRVLITGAGSGLGAALARCFAAAGWSVACSDVRGDAALATVSTLPSQAAATLALTLDVRSEADFDAAIARLQQAWGGIDVLINNAGVATAGTVATSPLEQWRYALDINLLGCVRGARAVIPRMREQGAGCIVNVASFAGVANPPALASYSASKAAVISLSETLRFELAADGIGVIVVAPSFFPTDLLNSGRGELDESVHNAAPQMRDIVEHLMRRSPLTADDVARDVFSAVGRHRFRVVSHADARRRLRLKRWAPEAYFRLALKATAVFLRPRRQGLP